MSVLQNVTVDDTATLEDVVSLLCAKKATACGVLDSKTKELVGMLTESDVVNACFGCAVEKTLAASFPVSNMIKSRKLEKAVLRTALPTPEIFMEFAVKMGLAHCKHLPVVSTSDQFVGIMTAPTAVHQILRNESASFEWLTAAARSLDLHDSSTVVCLNSTATVADAVAIMRKGKKAVIVTPPGTAGSRKMAGIVTISDILRRAIARDSSGFSWVTQRISSIMTPHTVVKSMPEHDANIVASLEVMIENGFRHMPIVADRSALGSIVGGITTWLTLGLVKAAEPEEDYPEVRCVVGIDDVLQTVARIMAFESRKQAEMRGEETKGAEMKGDECEAAEEDSLSARSHRSESVSSLPELVADVLIECADAFACCEKAHKLMKRALRRVETASDPDKLFSIIQPAQQCIEGLGAFVTDGTCSEEAKQALHAFQTSLLLQLLQLLIVTHADDKVCFDLLTLVLRINKPSSQQARVTHMRLKGKADMEDEFSGLVFESINSLELHGRVLAALNKLVVPGSFYNYGKGHEADNGKAERTLASTAQICCLLEDIAMQELAFGAAEDVSTTRTGFQLLQASWLNVEISCRACSALSSSEFTERIQECTQLYKSSYQSPTSIAGAISATSTFGEASCRYIEISQKLEKFADRRSFERSLSNNITGAHTTPSKSDAGIPSPTCARQLRDLAAWTCISQAAYALSVRGPTVLHCCAAIESTKQDPASWAETCIDQMLKDSNISMRKSVDWYEPAVRVTHRANMLADATSEITRNTAVLLSGILSLWPAMLLCLETVRKAPAELIGGDLSKGECIGRGKAAKYTIMVQLAAARTTCGVAASTLGTTSETYVAALANALTNRLMAAMSRNEAASNENASVSATKGTSSTGKQESGAVSAGV